jgi:hypothetical protein
MQLPAGCRKALDEKDAKTSASFSAKTWKLEEKYTNTSN